VRVLSALSVAGFMSGEICSAEARV